MVKVSSDDAARQAVNQMKSIIENQLLHAITNLQKQGDILAEPHHWSGPSADKYRGDWQGHNKAALTKMQKDLSQIQREVEKVTASIMHAGGATG